MINDEDLSGGLREEFTCQFCGKRFSVSKRFLDIAGDYIPQQCPECYDKEREQEKAAEMRKIREKLPDIYLASFNLGYDLKHASFENFQPQSERQMKAFEYAREFVSNDDYIVLFFGKTGNGKTHLAVSMLREWCSKDQPDCEYVTEKEIFDDLMTALSSKTTTMESVVKRYVNVEQLVIDEIGRAESTPFKKENLLAIVTQRLERKKKTVIIGNMTKDAIVNYFSDAIISRMQAGGKSFLFMDRDYRYRESKA